MRPARPAKSFSAQVWSTSRCDSSTRSNVLRAQPPLSSSCSAAVSPADLRLIEFQQPRRQQLPAVRRPAGIKQDAPVLRVLNKIGALPEARRAPGAVPVRNVSFTREHAHSAAAQGTDNDIAAHSSFPFALL